MESCLTSGLCWYKRTLTEHNGSSTILLKKRFNYRQLNAQKKICNSSLGCRENRCREYRPFVDAKSQSIVRMHSWAHRLVLDKTTEIKTVGITLLFVSICSNLIPDIFFWIGYVSMGTILYGCPSEWQQIPRSFSGFFFNAPRSICTTIIGHCLCHCDYHFDIVEEE